MKYDRIKGLEKDISRMVFGCDWLYCDSPEKREQSFRALDAVYAVGCNALDTAHIYCGGESERAIGSWMEARGNRENIVVLTKGAHHNRDRRRVTPYDIESDIHDSLARLRSGYIDIYVLHRDDPAVNVGPIVEELNSLRARGMIRAFGGSNWTNQRIEQANEYAYKRSLQPFTASSPNFGLAEQVQNPWGEGCVGLNGTDRKEAREWYERNRDVKIFAYSSLARGFFSGRITSGMSVEQGKGLLDQAAFTAYFHPVNLKRLARVEEMARDKGLTVPQIAVAYALNHPLGIFSLQAPRTPEEMIQNNEAIDLMLTSDEMAWLNLER